MRAMAPATRFATWTTMRTKMADAVVANVAAAIRAAAGKAAQMVAVGRTAAIIAVGAAVAQAAEMTSAVVTVELEWLSALAALPGVNMEVKEISSHSASVEMEVDIHLGATLGKMLMTQPRALRTLVPVSVDVLTNRNNSLLESAWVTPSCTTTSPMHLTAVLLAWPSFAVHSDTVVTLPREYYLASPLVAHDAA